MNYELILVAALFAFVLAAVGIGVIAYRRGFQAALRHYSIVSVGAARRA